MGESGSVRESGVEGRVEECEGEWESGSVRESGEV